MTQTQEMILGANRFFFYAMNFPSVPITFPSIAGGTRTEYLPDFFKVFPDYMVEHFVGKWKSAFERQGSYGGMMDFYGELSSNYRKDILQYIMENYDDEQKIRFGEE